MKWTECQANEDECQANWTECLVDWAECLVGRGTCEFAFKVNVAHVDDKNFICFVQQSICRPIRLCEFSSMAINASLTFRGSTADDQKQVCYI